MLITSNLRSDNDMPKRGKPSHHESAVRKQLGLWLKTVREAADLTQEEAAQRSGVKQDVIAKAEQGRRDLRTSNFLRLLRHYKADMELLDLIHGRSAHEAKQRKPA